MELPAVTEGLSSQLILAEFQGPVAADITSVTDTGDWFARGLAALRHKQAENRCSEADVSMNLVVPCIEEVLQYPPADVDAEALMNRKRPDYVCRGADGRAEVIIEVKNLDTPLTKRLSSRSAWHSSPYGQVTRYLERYPIARDGTWGTVTNGQDWILLRRVGQDVEQLASARVDGLADVDRMLRPIRESRRKRVQRMLPLEEPESPNWLDLLQNPDLTPTEFVREARPDGSEAIILERQHALARTTELPALEGEFWGRSVWLACLKIDLPDRHVAPPDITEELRPIIEARSPYRVYGIAYWKDLEDETRCRGFLWERGAISTTSALDPHFPGFRGAKQIRDLARVGSLDDAGDVLSGNELRREFYEEVDRWFRRTPRGRNDLRHMIRILFAWLLQERGVLPDTALWDPSEVQEAEGMEIHSHLEWLFSGILAVEERKRHPDDAASLSRRWPGRRVPFLNGSLYTPLASGEEPTALPNRLYVAVGGQPGLFRILRRYDWTLREQTGYETESALDPSMLGTLFERLMLSAEGPRVDAGGNIRMPGGSYYTPQDLVDEMTSDAIAHWLSGKIRELGPAQVRNLVHPIPADTNWKRWGRSRKDEVRARLEKVTVFDPCCGSGAFTVGMLQALLRAHRRLGNGRSPAVGPGSLEWIVEKQLHAADIHPLAVLITRLRLFLALVDAQWSGRDGQVGALPNLETRCGTADTLCVELSDGGQTQQLGSDEWDKAIGDWQASRELWVRAHSEGDKADALREERKARRVLKHLAEWRPGYDSAWLDVEFLAAAERPSSIDVRKQFVAPRGWDIVIGNPPYQRSDKRDRERGDRLGYRARHNLYTMFIEAALEVAGEHGCVTLVVPHSIVFRRESSYRKLRQVIESAADGVEIRTYDNRPKPVFPKVPWIKGHRTSVESRQRVTILSVRKGTSAEENVFGCGLIRLDAENRGEILRADRRAVAQPRFRRQWTHAPTRETVELLRRMWRESKVQPRKTATARTVAFPRTGMYFVTCLPSELSPLRNPKLHSLNDDEYFWPWIGLYNSHLFHAYWLMTGDAFHVTATEFAAIEPPAGWKDESLRSRTEETSRRLVSTSVLDACKVVHTGRGRSRWPNVSFHSAQAGRMVVTAVDRLLLEAYGLGERPLLDQIRIMRTGSAHLIQ